MVPRSIITVALIAALVALLLSLSGCAAPAPTTTMEIRIETPEFDPPMFPSYEFLLRELKEASR